MAAFSGRCHCGAIKFSFVANKITQAMRCNCSICRRHGAALSNFTIPASQLDIQAANGALRSYKFGTRTASHHFCNICGVFTFVETRLNPGSYRVNLGCIDDIAIETLEVIDFDASGL